MRSLLTVISWSVIALFSLPLMVPVALVHALMVGDAWPFIIEGVEVQMAFLELELCITTGRALALLVLGDKTEVSLTDERRINCIRTRGGVDPPAGGRFEPSLRQLNEFRYKTCIIIYIVPADNVQPWFIGNFVEAPTCSINVSCAIHRNIHKGSISDILIFMFGEG